MYKVVRDWTREYLKRKKAVRDMRKRRNAFAEPRHRLYDAKKKQFYYQRQNENIYGFYVRLEQDYGVKKPELLPSADYLGFRDVNKVEVYSDDYTEQLQEGILVYGNTHQNPEFGVQPLRSNLVSD